MFDKLVEFHDATYGQMNMLHQSLTRRKHGRKKRGIKPILDRFFYCYYVFLLKIENKDDEKIINRYLGTNNNYYIILFKYL